MDAKELTELALAKSGETSLRAFATRVGVSHVAVGYWLAGTSVPTFEQAAELAALAGLPIIKTASEVRLHSPQAAKHKAILRRLAATATLLVVGVLGSLPAPAQAATAAFKAAPECALCEIRQPAQTRPCLVPPAPQCRCGARWLARVAIPSSEKPVLSAFDCPQHPRQPSPLAAL